MENNERYRDSVKVSILSTITNTLLSILKFVLGIISNSASLIADAIHSLSDLITDFIVIVSMKISNKPEDKEHPYGHIKVETLASFILGIILLIVGLNIAYQNILSIIDWFNGKEIELNTGIIFWVVVIISILSKELLYQITIRVGKKHNNYSVIANAWHHRSDSLGAISVLFGTSIAKITGFQAADFFAAIVVSVLIIHVGIKILLESGNILIDKSAKEEVIMSIDEIVNNTDGVNSIKSLKTREVSDGIYIDMEILVDYNMNVDLAHQITEKVELNLFKKGISVKDINIHIEPDFLLQNNLVKKI